MLHSPPSFLPGVCPLIGDTVRINREMQKGPGSVLLDPGPFPALSVIHFQVFFQPHFPACTGSSPVSRNGVIPDTAEPHILLNDPALVFSMDNPCFELRFARISSKEFLIQRYDVLLGAYVYSTCLLWQIILCRHSCRSGNYFRRAPVRKRIPGKIGDPSACFFQDYRRCRVIPDLQHRFKEKPGHAAGNLADIPCSRPASPHIDTAQHIRKAQVKRLAYLLLLIIRCRADRDQAS